MREKLVDLIKQIVIPFWAGQIADHLISNDVVPVVRCKDCKHYQTEDWDGNVLCGCTLHSAMLDITPDGYCSYGERKDGEG